jgi:hypothetical protein
MYLLVFARQLWWMNQEFLELSWERIIDQKMAAVLGGRFV